MYQVDLNCDLGESFGLYQLGKDQDILKYVTSVNVACGFHAGDPHVMRKTVEQAIKNNVKIGAHPGLPDLIGFGRRNIQITPQEAYDMVVYQIGALQAVLTTFQQTMQHVKPHGALYNMAAKDKDIAEAVAQAVFDVSPSLVLFGLSGSELTKAGEAIGLTTVHEVFADRTYQSDGSLTSRQQDGALITDIDQSVTQVLRMIKEGEVMSVQGTSLPLKAHTICIHGDGEHALQFVNTIRASLKAHDIKLRPITDWKEYI